MGVSTAVTLTSVVAAMLALLPAVRDAPAANRPPAACRIADVLLEFVHTCTPTQCDELNAIVADRSARPGERMLARPLRRVIHTAHPEDLPGLKRMSQRGRDQAMRRLAMVIGRLVHVPSGTDMKILSQLPDLKGTGPLCGDDGRTAVSGVKGLAIRGRFEHVHVDRSLSLLPGRAAPFRPGSVDAHERGMTPMSTKWLRQCGADVESR